VSEKVPQPLLQAGTRPSLLADKLGGGVFPLMRERNVPPLQTGTISCRQINRLSAASKGKGWWGRSLVVVAINVGKTIVEPAFDSICAHSRSIFVSLSRQEHAKICRRRLDSRLFLQSGRGKSGGFQRMGAYCMIKEERERESFAIVTSVIVCLSIWNFRFTRERAEYQDTHNMVQVKKKKVGRKSVRR